MKGTGSRYAAQRKPALLSTVIAGLGALLLAGCGGPPPEASQVELSHLTVETFDGERIRYVRSGEHTDAGRPALLFVPGWTMAAEIWEPQLAHFERSHLVVAMDPRSQGYSSKARDGHTAAARARDIRAVVEALELEPVVLIGWSMAVTELVAYVDAFGTEGVAGLVLVDGVAGDDWTPELALVFLDWTAGFVHDREAATREFVRGMYRRHQSEAYLESVVQQSLRTPTDAAAALIVGAGRNDFRHTLSHIDRPVLVTVTRGSPWDDDYQEMAARIPDWRLEWFDGAGHALFVDEAERFNRLLETFLAGVGGGGRLALEAPEFSSKVPLRGSRR